MSKNNSKSPMSEKKRLAVIIGSIVIGLVVVVTAVNLNSKNTKEAATDANANVSVNVDSNTGNPLESKNPDYIGKVKTANEENYQNALANGNGHIDTMVNKERPIDENSFLGAASEPVTTQEPIVNDMSQTVSQPTEPQVIKQIIVMKEPKYDYTKDEGLVGALRENWKNKSFVLNTVSNRSDAKENQNQTSSSNQSNSSDSNTGNKDDEEVVLFKASDLTYAVLQTSIDSREDSPIRARIVSGEYAGSTIAGSFKKTGDKVVVEFSVLNSDKFKRSIPINAVAMDLNTTKTALADSVNKHIPERLLWTMAGAFASGYADGLSDSNKTTVISDSGAVTNVTGNLDTKDITKKGIAKSLEEGSNIINDTIPKTSTVKVNANKEIAVFFTSDLVVNKSLFKE